MNITIASPNGQARPLPISKDMLKHFQIPINHAHTILTQINSGMYKKWFEGKENLRCIDIGANVGLVSLYMLPACKELYCLEPTPSHFALLKELIGENNNVHCYQQALNGKNEEVIFMTGHSTENKITSADGYGNGKITVKGITLSSYLYLSGAGREIVDFCKIDIESGEMLALTVGELKKVKGKIKTFFVEVHPGYNGGMDENREELKKRFIKAGYKVYEEDYQTIVAEL